MLHPRNLPNPQTQIPRYKFNPKFQFEFEPQDTKKFEFLDLEDFGGVAILVKLSYCTKHLCVCHRACTYMFVHVYVCVRECVCTFTYIYTCMNMCTQMYRYRGRKRASSKYLYIHICIHICTGTHTFSLSLTHTHKYIHIYLQVLWQIHLWCMYLHVHICLHVCIHAWKKQNFDGKNTR